MSYERILDRLMRNGVEPEKATPEDLHEFDMMHTGRVEATDTLAREMSITEGMRVLDAGAGLGGTSRRVAHRYGALVCALELTPQVCATATALTRLVRLTDKVTFANGNALDMPYVSGYFDAVIVQHFAMQVRDKSRLFDECTRVLKPCGVLAIHDWFTGTGSPPVYPMPWADSDQTSALEPWQSTSERLERRGFEVGPLALHTEQSLRGFRQAESRRAQARFRHRAFP